MKTQHLLLATTIFASFVDFPAIAEDDRDNHDNYPLSIITKTKSVIAPVEQNLAQIEEQKSPEPIKTMPIEKRVEAEKEAESLLEKFDDRMKRLGKQIKDKKDKVMEEIREERNEVGKHYEELKESSKEHWDSVKKRFIEAYDALERKFEKKEREEKANSDIMEKNEGQ